MTLAFALLLAAGVVLEIAVLASRHSDLWLAAALVLFTVVVCGAALVRRRFPGRAAAVAITACAAAELLDWRTERAGQPAPIACLALLVVVASAVRFLPGAAGPVLVAAGSGVVAAGTVERYATYLAEGIPNARTASLVMVTGWTVAVVIGLRLRLGDTRRRAMADRVRRTERLALARDLHDVAGHHLTGLIIQAQVAQLAGHSDPAGTRASLSEIEAAGSQALASLRQVVRLLRDGEPVAVPDLAELTRRFDGTGTRAWLDLPDPAIVSSWPVETTIGIYRIAQEALTNVVRHAPDARTVAVTLAQDARTIRLRITDDGRAAVAARPDGHGLIGMRERAAALGGELTAGPGTPHGWTVDAAIPVPGAP